MLVIIVTAIMSTIISVGVSAAIIIKITTEIQKGVAECLMKLFEENLNDSMQFYKSVNEMLTKAGF